MTKIKIDYLLPVVVAVAMGMSSCQSNEIYLDINKQVICSSSSRGINELTIKNAKGIASYSIVWTDTTKNAPLKLSLSPLTKGYIIVKGWRDTLANFHDFRLDANTVYLIHREGGDAGGYFVKVLTDEHGLFQKIAQ